MKKYFGDTNLFLRFLLPEPSRQKEEAQRYFQDAKARKITIIVCQLIIFEVCFALEKYYQQSRLEVYRHLKNIASASYFIVEEREIFLEALEIYKNKNVDFVDAFLFCKARSQNAQVLSFDKDFKKIAVAVKLTK